MNDSYCDKHCCEEETRIVSDEARKMECLAYRYFGIKSYE